MGIEVSYRIPESIMFATPRATDLRMASQPETNAVFEDQTIVGFLTFQALFLAYYSDPSLASVAVRGYIAGLIDEAARSGQSVLHTGVKDLTGLNDPLHATDEDIDRLTSLQTSIQLQEIFLPLFFESPDIRDATRLYPQSATNSIRESLQKLLKLSTGSVHNQFDATELDAAEESIRQIVFEMNALKWDDLLERIEEIELLAKLARHKAKVKYQASNTMPGNDIIANAYNTYNQNLADLHSRLLALASNKIQLEVNRNPNHPLLKYLGEVKQIIDIYTEAWNRNYAALTPSARKRVNALAFYNLEPEKLQSIVVQRLKQLSQDYKRTILTIILNESDPFPMTNRLISLPEDHSNTAIADAAIAGRHLTPTYLAEDIMGSDILDLPVSSLMPDLQGKDALSRVEGCSSLRELKSLPSVSQSTALRQNLIASVLEVGWKIRPELKRISPSIDKIDKVAEHIIIRGFDRFHKQQQAPQIYVEPAVLADRLQLLVRLYRHMGLMITTEGLPEFAQEICGIPAQRLAEVVFQLKETNDYSETARILADVEPLFPVGPVLRMTES